MSHYTDNILQYKAKPVAVLKLVLDNETAISMGDKPIFGSTVTISEKTKQLVGRLLMPGVVIGWVNDVDVNKFACITHDNHYLEASQFIFTEYNQIVLAKAIKILSVNDDMHTTKEILTFSES